MADQEYERLYQTMMKSNKLPAELGFIAKKKDARETYADLSRRLDADVVVYQQHHPAFDVRSLPPDVLNYLTFVINQAPGQQQSKPQPVCEIKRTRINDLTFNDVAGQQALKSEMFLNYIYPNTYTGLFQEESKGVMLYGPPGTGKTYIVKAATSAIPHAAFFAPSTGELLGKYLGDVEKKIDNLFRCAALETKHAGVKNSIIFLDEFDTLAGLKGDDKSMARSVNALLQAMDGVQSRKGVSVVAATNYPWRIEPAVVRRFGNQVFVDLPDPTAILQIMEMSIANNYALPGTPKNNRYEMLKGLDHGVYTYINQWGAGLCSSEKIQKTIQGYVYSSKGEVSGKMVTQEFLKNIIIKHLGMNVAARKIKEDISGTRERLLAESYEKQNYNFGYSPSDVSKVMQIATKMASERALYAPFIQTSIGGKTFYLSSNKGEYKLLGEGGKKIPSSDYGNVYNFALCEHDIMNAISSYKSTINAQDYMDLVRYSIWRLSPDD